MYQLSGFIPANIKINSWKDIEPYFHKLISSKPDSSQDLEKLINQYSEVISVFYEQFAWTYINMSCYTDNQDYVKKYEVFASEIEPEISKAANKVDKVITGSGFFNNLEKARYAQLMKKLNRDLEMFREKNVPIFAELSKLSSEYEQKAGSLTASINGEDLPMPMASVKLLSEDRDVRKTAWLAIQESRYSAKPEMDVIFDKMVEKRHKVALNAGYKNYRDYQHDNLHRFDYTPKDAAVFHDAIEKHVVPLAKDIDTRLRDKLGLGEDDFRPWDQLGEPAGQKPLKPFETGKELLAGAIKIFSQLNPEFGENLKKMDKAGLFDLDSRKAKAPGGYNYPLEVTGMPFIFMNAAGTQRDVTTMMHEGGHAMHTFLTNNESLVQYRDTPSEMAETASMAMELMTAGNWNEYYSEKDHIRARREHLEGIISFFPWCAIVDAFQHWIYLNPGHTGAQRDEAFKNLMDRFGTGLMNWSGYENFYRNHWQRQSHIFSVPFYYIEYGIAQLGALQVYRNFKADPVKGLEGYMRGLSLGSSKPLPEVWAAMNIQFDFSAEIISELMQMVQEELNALQ